MIDAERLRPGNVVRHLGGTNNVGEYKVLAVKKRLADTGFQTDHVSARIESVTRLTDAIDIVKTQNVVLDATANARATRG